MKKNNNSNEMAVSWDLLHKYTPAPRHRRKIILNILKKIKFSSLLDVGCAQPYLFEALSNSGINLYGCDISNQIISLNKTRFPNAKFEVVDISKGIFSNNAKFDMVVSSEVLEHINDWKAAIKNLSAMSYNYLLITVPSGRIYPIDTIVGHYQHFEIQELSHEIKRHGFDITIERRWGFPFHTLYKKTLNLFPEKVYHSFVDKQKQFGFSKKIISNALYYFFFLNYFFKKGSQIIILAQRQHFNMQRRECIICGSPIKKRIKISEQRLSIGNEFNYSVCSCCNLVSLLDKPLEMEPYYKNYQYHKKLSVSDEPFSFSSFLHKKGSGFLLKPLERYYPSNDLKNIKILDVGCARGEYLSSLKQSGFRNLHGIESSREAFINCVDKSLNISCITLEAFKTNDQFDLITLNQVFEHIKNPITNILKLKSLLNPNGKIVMSFPNYSSFARVLFKGFWPGYDAPRHHFTFNPFNVKRLAEKVGLKILKVRYISRPSQFLGSFQYIYNKLRKNKCSLEDGFFRNNKCLDLLFFIPAYFLNLVKLGDMIEIWLIHVSPKISTVIKSQNHKLESFATKKINA